MNRYIKKRTIRHVRHAKNQISQYILAVWSFFVVHMRNFAFLSIQNAHSEDSDQTVGAYAKADLNLS